MNGRFPPSGKVGHPHDAAGFGCRTLFRRQSAPATRRCAAKRLDSRNGLAFGRPLRTVAPPRTFPRKVQRGQPAVSRSGFPQRKAGIRIGEWADRFRAEAHWNSPDFQGLCARSGFDERPSTSVMIDYDCATPFANLCDSSEKRGVPMQPVLADLVTDPAPCHHCVYPEEAESEQVETPSICREIGDGSST